MGRAPSGRVVVDCFPERMAAYGPEYAVIAVDVLRATTTALTSVASGRRCIPVDTIDAALEAKQRIPDALLAGELQGVTPPGFDIDNSPAAVAARADRERPLVLLSTSGTRLLCGGAPGQTVYAAGLRNYLTQAAYAAGRHESIVVMGAGSRNEFRREDALCCAWIAAALMQAGYEAGDDRTREVIDTWRDQPVDVIRHGHSANFLRKSDKMADLDFVVNHVNDLVGIAVMCGGELEFMSGAP